MSKLQSPANELYPVEKCYRGLIMLGKINTQQKCPECGRKFTAKHRNEDGFFCPNHPNIYAKRYLVDGTPFVKHTWRIYRDPSTGKVFRDYQDAVDVLIAMNRDHKEGKFKGDKWIPKKVADKIMDNIIVEWLAGYETELKSNLKSKTRVDKLSEACKYFITPFFKDENINALDHIKVKSFYHNLLKECTCDTAGMQCQYTKCPGRKRLSSRYIKDILDTLRAIIAYYRPNDIPKPWPTFTVVSAREKQLLGMAREISALDKVPDRHGYRIACLVLLRTGMRINEAVVLRVSDLVDGVLFVSKGQSDGEVRNDRKAGQPKTYRVAPELWDLLMAHTAGKGPDDFVFPDDFALPDGKKHAMKTGRLYKVWKKACSDAGVKHISLQQASRHSFATEIKNKHDKAAAAEIMDQLGHENTTTGKTYMADRQGLN